jgi:hypothetical protein
MNALGVFGGGSFFSLRSDSITHFYNHFWSGAPRLHLVYIVCALVYYYIIRIWYIKIIVRETRVIRCKLPLDSHVGHTFAK